MLTKEIKIVVDEDEAKKSTDNLTDSFDGLNSAVDKTNENAEKGIENTGKAAKNTDKAVKGANKSVKAVGASLKALGIGLIIALVAKLTEVFSKNQKVVDFFSTAMETLNIAFNDLFNFVGDNFGKWVDAIKSVFENPKESVIAFGDAIKENLVERFNSFLDTLGYISTAIKKLFAGDLDGALESIKQAGVESLDILTGVDNTMEKVVETTKKVASAVSEYTKNTIKAASANVQLKNTAQLAAAQQQLLVEKYDILAEKQRQVRDEERNSISDRIKANNELKDVLDQQEKAMLGAANAQIAAAQATLNTNNNIENQVALTEALANKQGVLAQVEGFRSEQLVNDLALKREQIELDNSITDAEKERQLSKLEFEAELALTEDEKLIKQQERLDLENEIIKADFARKMALYEEGTQLRVDAEQEFLNQKQSISQQQQLLDKQTAENQIALDEKVKNAKIGIAQSTLSLISEVAGKGSKIGKGIAVAQATISAIQGTQNAYTTAQKSPITAVFPAYPLLQAGIAGAFGALQVKKILSTDESGQSASSLSNVGGGGASSPSFNLVQGTGTNQIAENIQSQDQTIKAFVVSEDVTTGQDLDNDAINNASI